MLEHVGGGLTDRLLAKLISQASDGKQSCDVKKQQWQLEGQRAGRRVSRPQNQSKQCCNGEPESSAHHKTTRQEVVSKGRHFRITDQTDPELRTPESGSEQAHQNNRSCPSQIQPAVAAIEGKTDQQRRRRSCRKPVAGQLGGRSGEQQQNRQQPGASELMQRLLWRKAPVERNTCQPQ